MPEVSGATCLYCRYCELRAQPLGSSYYYCARFSRAIVSSAVSRISCPEFKAGDAPDLS